MDKKADIVIIGGGLAGMTMACAAACNGLQVIIIERNSLQNITDSKSDSRCSAIAYGSYKILNDAGIWQHINGNYGPISQIRVSDQDSFLFLHYDHKLIGENPLGYMVENHVMLKALYKRVSELHNITIYDNARYSTIENNPNNVVITLEDSIKITASLLIAADGRNSDIRRKNHIGIVEKNYGQTGIVCNVKHEKPHNQIAHERFLAPGPFAILPMHNPNLSSLVWTEQDNIAAIYLKMTEDELNEHINHRFGSFLGDVKLDSKLFSYPLNLIHAKNYTAPRMALIGDAAHGIHPLAGQGFNLGIRDVGVLAELIGNQHKLGLDIGSGNILEEYSKLRKFDAITLIAITGGLNNLFSNNILPLKLARRIGMAAVNKCTPLKKILMRHAMGL